MRLGRVHCSHERLGQESLLDVCDEPELGELGTSVRRTPLARGAWIDLRPGWLAGSGAVFSRLVQTVPWRAEKRHMYDKPTAPAGRSPRALPEQTG